jgi:ribosome-associated toxin RatA of RatAB toxin-antitoxin module
MVRSAVFAELHFPIDAIRKAAGPLVAIRSDAAGRPLAAAAGRLIEAPVDRVWALVSDVASYPGRVPMLEKVELKGDRVVVRLKFGISLFSVKFSFTAAVSTVEKRTIELKHVAGEPDKLVLRYDLESLDDGSVTLVHAGIAFDPDSLGWLAKYFLRHHPEIRYGIFPGSAVALVESMRLVAEGKP